MCLTLKIRVTFVLLLGLACGRLARGQNAVESGGQATSARADVEELIRQSGAEVALAFQSFDSNQQVFIRADQEFRASSEWIEIPVLIALYAEVQARELQLDDTLVIRNRFQSIADGSVYHLDPSRDPDPELYKEIDRPMTLRHICELMMARDSQLAANLLIQKIGVARIRQQLGILHADGIQLRHGFQDAKAKNSGLQNTISARGMMEILWALAKGNAVSPEISQEIIGMIANSRTQGADGLNGEGAVGNVSGTYQQALIVYGAHSFVLAAEIHGLKSNAANAALAAQISHRLAAAN